MTEQCFGVTGYKTNILDSCMTSYDAAKYRLLGLKAITLLELGSFQVLLGDIKTNKEYIAKIIDKILNTLKLNIISF